MVRPRTITILISSGLLGLVVIGLFFMISARRREPFSPTTMASLWRNFQNTYVEASTGRVTAAHPDVTTSQDQALTMLRAAWMNDQATFNRTWGWMKTYLQHKDDTLPAAQYGLRADGSYGILPGASGSASGADIDTALALLFGYARWGQGMYQETARRMMDDIWVHDVLLVGPKPYLLAGSAELEKKTPTALVRSGELATYAFRIFRGIDPTHDWEGLLNNSYELIEKSITAPLDKKGSDAVLPNAFLINRETGQIISGALPAGTTSDFDAGAAMLPWRLALDWQWYGDDRAKQTLEKMDFLDRAWRQQGKVPSRLAHDGKIVDAQESSSVYGGALGYFLISDSAVAAKDIINRKLGTTYDQKLQILQPSLSLADATWVWLGLALSQEILPNLLPAPAVNQLQEQFIEATEAPTM